MASTTKRPRTGAATSSVGTANGPVADVFTLTEAAAYLRFPEATVIELVQSQQLPGRSIGGEWRFLKSAIQHWLAAGPSGSPSRKEAQMALAGKYQDDPDLTRICREAYEQRGRAMVEGA